MLLKRHYFLCVCVHKIYHVLCALSLKKMILDQNLNYKITPLLSFPEMADIAS